MDKKCCFTFGTPLIWDSDANANEVSSEYDDDDFATIQYYHCPKCGRSYEVVEPTHEEKEKDYKEYWENN